MTSPNQAFLQRDLKAAVSKLADLGVNQTHPLAADFEGILVNPFNPPFPDFLTVSDEDQVGDGTEFAKNIRNYAVNEISFPIGGKLNTEVAARILARFLGGAMSNNLVTTGVYDHEVAMKLAADGIVPPFFTFAAKQGGNDFIWPVSVDQFSITQQMNQEPQWTAQIKGTGFHKRFRDVYRVQTITITGAPAGGTFTITYDGLTTTPIAFDASAAAVLTALEALANVAPGDFTATGGPLPGLAVTLTATGTGAFANAEVKPMSANGALLTGGATPAATAAPSVPLLVLPAPPDYHYMHGGAVEAVMNDGSVRTLNDAGLLSYQIQMNNGITVIALPNGLFLNPGDVSSGNYADFVRLGTRTVQPQVKLFLDPDLPEYYYRRKNLEITTFKIKNVGERIPGTAYNHEFEITVPFSKIQTMQSDAEGDMAAKSFTLIPEKDPVTLGIAKARIRNATPTLT